jgi:siroheme synthase
VLAAGTTPRQEAVVATLATVVEAAEGAAPPALVVVGDVVALSTRLARAHGTLALA